jgi:hypothetical protein
MTMPQRNNSEDDRSSLAHLHSRDLLCGGALRVQHLDVGLSRPGHDILGGHHILVGRDDLRACVQHSVKPGHLSRDADNIQCRRATDHHDGGWHGPLVGTHI